MATEILNLEVKSDIKGVVVDVNALAVSLKQAELDYVNLNTQVKIQKDVVLKLEKELINLKALQISTPRTAIAGYPQLIKKIKSTTTELALERNGLKDLNNQRAESKILLDQNVQSLGKLQKASKGGKKGFDLLKTGARGFGLALKAMGIGLIISALLFLRNALMGNEKIMKTVTTATNIVSNAVDDFVTVLTDTYTWLTSTEGRFNALGKVITSLITLYFTPLKLQFYQLKLALQVLALGFYEVKARTLGGAEDVRKANEYRAAVRQTGNDIIQVGKDAAAAAVSLYNNLGEATGELVDIYKQVATGVAEIKKDSNKRNTEILGDLRDYKAELLAFKKDLVDKEKDERAKTKLEEIAIARERHLAQLKNLQVEAAERKELEDRINKIYDDQETEIRVKREKEEAAILAKMREENMLAEIEDARDRALKILEIEYNKDLEALKGHENFLELKAELDKKYARGQKALDIQSVKWNDQTTKQKLKLSSDAFGQLSEIMGKESKAGKAAAISQALISTYLGAQESFTSMAKINPVLGYVAAAAAVASGLANVNAIRTGGGGGGGSTTPPAEIQTPAPEMMSGAFELGGGQPVEPTRAYVVSDDITNNQNGLEIIRRRATI